MSLDNESSCFVISGSPMFVVSATEAVVWLASACRASTTPDSIQSCRLESNEVLAGEHDGAFVANTVISDLGMNLGSSTGNCWHAMFRNPVVVEWCPVPARTSEEKGLELSVELMLSLAQISWATVYMGVLMLKGFATLLTPTLKVGSSVIWHLTTNLHGERQSYNDGLQLSHIQTIDEAIFDGARHFVGWLKSAEYLVGMSGVSFVTILQIRNIRYHKPRHVLGLR